MSLDVQIFHHQDPALEFGTGEAATPKTGLSDFGPYSLRLGASHREQLQIGIVGTADSIRKAKSFLERVQKGTRSGSDNLALAPDFPGFSSVFSSTLNIGIEHVIRTSQLQDALSRRPRESFIDSLELSGSGVASLAERDVRPDPWSAPCHESSSTVVAASSNRYRRDLLIAARREEEQPLAGQGNLFELDSSDSIEQNANLAAEDIPLLDFVRLSKPTQCEPGSRSS